MVHVHGLIACNCIYDIRACVSSRNRHLTVQHQLLRVTRIVLPFSELKPYHESKDHEHSPGPTMSEQPGTRGAHSDTLTIFEPNPSPTGNVARYSQESTRKSNSIAFRSLKSHASLFGERASVT